MNTNQSIKITDEKIFLERIPKMHYITADVALSLCKNLGIELIVIDERDSKKKILQRMTEEVTEIEGTLPPHIHKCNGTLMIGKMKDKIMVKAYFGKYLPTAILFHEIGHWIEFAFQYKRDFLSYECNYILKKMTINNDVLHSDLTESIAWVYGAFAALSIDHLFKTSHYFSCIEQLCRETASNNGTRPITDLAVYMLQRSINRFDIKSNESFFDRITSITMPIIKVLDDESVRIINANMDTSSILTQNCFSLKE